MVLIADNICFLSREIFYWQMAILADDLFFTIETNHTLCLRRCRLLLLLRESPKRKSSRGRWGGPVYVLVVVPIFFLDPAFREDRLLEAALLRFSSPRNSLPKIFIPHVFVSSKFTSIKKKNFINGLNRFTESLTKPQLTRSRAAYRFSINLNNRTNNNFEKKNVQ